MSTSLNMGESTFDAATGTLTGSTDVATRRGEDEGEDRRRLARPDERVVKMYLPADSRSPS